MSRLPSHLEISARVRIPASELRLSYARSGGPGGQHVNKTESKVLVRWSVLRSEALGEHDRAWLLERLAPALTREGDLLVSSDRHRDQGRNVQDALGRLAERVRSALRRPRKRAKTKPSAGARARRLDGKRKRGALKRQRRQGDED